MAEKYFAELERMWQQNRRDAGLPLPAIFNFQLEAGLRRPKALRGPDLVRELIRLAAVTKDVRFEDAVFALIEHRIVDGEYNFLPWDLPLLTESKERFRRLACVCIHLMKNSGQSLRRACAEHAARTGWPSMSFAAATKDLELLYRQHPEFVTPAVFAELRIERVAADGQALPIPADLLALFGEVGDPAATTLEKSCRTTIPTTADN